jgi:hypothetical protein
LPPRRKFGREQIEAWIKEDEEGMRRFREGRGESFLDAGVLRGRRVSRWRLARCLRLRPSGALEDLLEVKPEENSSGLQAIKANPSRRSVDANFTRQIETHRSYRRAWESLFEFDNVSRILQIEQLMVRRVGLNTQRIVL